MENQQQPEMLPLQEAQTTNGNFDKEKIARFYKQGLPALLKKFFYEPINGTQTILSEKNESSYFNAIILMASTMVLYIILPYIMIGEMREYVGFGKMFKIGLTILLLMLVISLIVFGIKSISGKPVLKNELLTGAICGIPFSLLLIFIFVLQLFAKDSLQLDRISSSFEAISSFQNVGMIAALVMLYVFLFLINIVQQSLKSAGTKDAFAWYLSPITILISFYITTKIAEGLFN